MSYRLMGISAVAWPLFPQASQQPASLFFLAVLPLALKRPGHHAEPYPLAFSSFCSAVSRARHALANSCLTLRCSRFSFTPYHKLSPCAILNLRVTHSAAYI